METSSDIYWSLDVCSQAKNMHFLLSSILLLHITYATDVVHYNKVEESCTLILIDVICLFLALGCQCRQWQWMLFWPPSSLLMAGKQFIPAERAVDFIFFLWYFIWLSVLPNHVIGGSNNVIIEVMFVDVVCICMWVMEILDFHSLCWKSMRLELFAPVYEPLWQLSC